MNASALCARAHGAAVLRYYLLMFIYEITWRNSRQNPLIKAFVPHETMTGAINVFSEAVKCEHEALAKQHPNSGWEQVSVEIHEVKLLGPLFTSGNALRI